jgi:tellurite methyltransferase
MQPGEYFDALYQSHDRYWWKDGNRYATDPRSFPRSLLTQLTLKLIRGMSGGRALDLGAGEGADSVRLAKLGFEVDAVEVSKVAAEKIHRFADEAGVAVRVIRADIRDHLLVGPYDLIICNGVLHYIADDDKVRMVRRMQDATRAGGLNVVSLWSTHTPVPYCHNSVPVFCDDEDGIVVGLYQQWLMEFIYFERGKQEESHLELPAHLHSHIKLIARRPG